MQYKKNGQVSCNAVDLAVLHQETQKGKTWATPEAFLNAPHREIPYIPSVQIFVLLAFQPQDETDYSYRLRQTLTRGLSIPSARSLTVRGVKNAEKSPRPTPH